MKGLTVNVHHASGTIVIRILEIIHILAVQKLLCYSRKIAYCLKIAVNTRLLLRNKMDGMGWFTYETMKRIVLNNKDTEFIFIFDRKFDDEFIFSDNVRPVIAWPQSRHPYLWYLYFEYGVHHVLKKNKPDLFLSTDGMISLRSAIPSVSVIHDLNFHHFPEFLTPLISRYYNCNFPKFAKKAVRLATVSEYSKKDISQTYGIPLNRIDVVYDGMNTDFGPLDPDTIDMVRSHYTEGAPYFLFVGSIHPRKNLHRIIKAFDRFRKSSNDKVKLLCVGGTYWMSHEIREALDDSPNKDDIIFTGHLETDELNNVYGAANCLVYTSLFEGFGIPILEAMQCDIPAITSTTTSMPEVGGDAVLYADPYSDESIATAMTEIYYNKELRKELIRKGNTRKDMFSWDQSATKLWDCIMRAYTEIKST